MNDEKDFLYQQLHSADSRIHEEVTQRLGQVYFGAAGTEEELRLLQAEQATKTGMYDSAEVWLNDLIMDFPHFAEAWNRRATLYYLVKCVSQSPRELN